VPEPQRQALEVALLRSPRSGGRADQRAVCLAVLGCLRSVVSTSPVGKLEAMAGRVLAETVGAASVGAPLWDAGKLEAMAGRVLAE
jgi:hypothetical protein